MSRAGMQVVDNQAVAAGAAIKRGVSHLQAAQHRDGYWWGDLTADSTLESDWFLLLLWLHPPRDGVWNPPNRAQIDRAVQRILGRQLPDGGFNIYAGGPAEISASVKAYFALKLAGLEPGSEPMSRLRERIIALGGLQAANSYTKLNLSFFNLYPRDCVPSVPPEMVLLPGGFLYRMSAWTRAIVVPLSIIQSLNSTGRPIPAGFSMDELVKPGAPYCCDSGQESASWRRLFRQLDGFWKWWERSGPKSIRRRALAKARDWMLDRFQDSDGLAAIYPPMMYAILALDLLGYPADHPVRMEAQAKFDNLLVDDERGLFFQPCFSPVWDTAIAAFALGESGVADAARLRQAGDWLLTKEVRRPGDWIRQRPGVEPSGWYFEFANEFYPDIDDSAMVLLGLKHTGATDNAALRACAARAVNWLRAMQGSDGGWAAFDADNNWNFLSHVPFADHNAMLDPSCPDITGRVLEALIAWGVSPDDACIRKGVQYLLKTQEPGDGSWHGRWGVNYIYGTFLALRGLRAAGYSDREAEPLRGTEWLRSVQNADGGWGESCASYDAGTFVEAASTPSQTAWAVLGLLAGGDTTSESVRRGVEHLETTQREDGGWDEESCTGTGFPRVFYLQYHLYRDMFPVMALAEYLKTHDTARGERG